MLHDGAVNLAAPPISYLRVGRFVWQVRHPNVKKRIFMDFVIMKKLAAYADRSPALKWMNLGPSMEQFSHTMAAQVQQQGQRVDTEPSKDRHELVYVAVFVLLIAAQTGIGFDTVFSRYLFGMYSVFIGYAFVLRCHVFCLYSNRLQRGWG